LFQFRFTYILVKRTSLRQVSCLAGRDMRGNCVEGCVVLTLVGLTPTTQGRPTDTPDNVTSTTVEPSPSTTCIPDWIEHQNWSAIATNCVSDNPADPPTSLGNILKNLRYVVRKLHHVIKSFKVWIFILLSEAPTF